MSVQYQHANEIITISKNTLWLGDCAAAQNHEWIDDKQIKLVITAAAGLDLKFNSNVVHLKYPMLDNKNQNITKYFNVVAQHIQKGLRVGSVLVHCGAGVSRSSTLVIAYLIKYHHMDFLQALRYVRAKRPCICPNLGFQLQLKKYAIERGEQKEHKQTRQTREYKEHSMKTSKQLKQLKQKSPQNHSLTIVQRPTTSFEWANRTFLNPHNSSMYSFQKMRSVIHRNRNTNVNQVQKQMVKTRMTQPKGWRVTYGLKPQISISDSKADTELYLRKMAKLRFGQSNVSKWGI